MSEYRVRERVCNTKPDAQASIQSHSAFVHSNGPQEIGLLHTATDERRSSQSRGGKAWPTSTKNPGMPVRYTLMPIETNKEGSYMHTLPKRKPPNSGRSTTFLPESQRVRKSTTKTKVTTQGQYTTKLDRPSRHHHTSKEPPSMEEFFAPVLYPHPKKGNAPREGECPRTKAGWSGTITGGEAGSSCLMRLRAQERQKGGSGPQQCVSRQTSRILEPAKPIQPNQGTRWGRYHKGRGRERGGVWVEAPSAIQFKAAFF